MDFEKKSGFRRLSKIDIKPSSSSKVTKNKKKYIKSQLSTSKYVLSKSNESNEQKELNINNKTERIFKKLSKIDDSKPKENKPKENIIEENKNIVNVVKQKNLQKTVSEKKVVTLANLKNKNSFKSKNNIKYVKSDFEQQIENSNKNISHDYFSIDDLRSSLKPIFNKNIDDKSLNTEKPTQEIMYTSKDFNKDSKDIIINNNLESINNNSKPINKKKQYDAPTVDESNLDSLLDELNKKVNDIDKSEVIIERFSFLNDKPEVKNISFKKYNMKNISANTNKIKTHKLESHGVVLEEIIIPDVLAIKDDVNNINDIVHNNFISKEQKSKEVMNIPNFVVLKNKVQINPSVVKNIEKVNKNQKKVEDLKLKEKNNYPKQPGYYSVPPIYINISENTSKNQSPVYTATNGKIPIPINTQIPPNKIHSQLQNSNNVVTSQKINEQIKDNSVDFFTKNKNMPPNTTFKQKALNYPQLIFTSKISSLDYNVKDVYDKYNIDDFTFVTISYNNDYGLFYDIVQPELTTEQKKEFNEIKNIFFNTIDRNYFSFNGDKHTVDNYIEKIYSLAINKLPYNLSSLNKKIYLKFLEREFSGLGILSNILLDRNILEVSCVGANTNIIVYHIKYGVLKTNLSFENIIELNRFVVALTKNMGLYVTSSHPIFNGYLPNGYKVEGIYSQGDISNKGSSFVIKKYLEKPITPISLIKTGVGSIDVFSYLWSTIDAGYKIVFTGKENNDIILNSVALMYPNKKIVTVQSYDRIKLPQKDWIKRTFIDSMNVSKQSILEQTIAERPDYIILDKFTKDVFDIAWYDIDMFSIDLKLLPELLSNIFLINQKTIIVKLERVSKEFMENLQIIDITEIVNKKETKVVELSENKDEYNINLLSSNIDIVSFKNKKEILRWMLNTKIYNYKDFNNIVCEYFVNPSKIKENLGIKID